ncbi:MAG: SGNH/GDSL hydrolase family protein [Clostridia bacterium]|nr:SGNH/GDSL hydrolase family protein [Clostridia bacterium]
MQYIENVLYGKKIVFDGDSICHGITVGADHPTYGWGWAGRIGTKNNMDWHNYAITSATINTSVHFSEPRFVIEHFERIYAEHPDLDYLILEGGSNDADLLGIERLGEISKTSMMYTDFDHTADFTQALEYLLSKAVALYPDKKIGFIIPHKMTVTPGDTEIEKKVDYKTHIRRIFFDRCAEVCEKYGIPCLDLWKTCHLNPVIDYVSNGNKFDMYYDGQHLTAKGYDYITPIIEAWLRTI